MIRICNVSGWTDSTHMGKCERDNALAMINEFPIEHFVVDDMTSEFIVR